MRNLLIAFLLSVFVLEPAKAAQGDLDTTFGQSGFAFVIPETIGEFSDGSFALRGVSVAIQSDGKVVVAGQVLGGVGEFAQEFALARFTVNGTLDPTFGSGGAVTTTFDLISIPKTVAVQSDGKIVVAGISAVSDPRVNSSLCCQIEFLVLARFTAQGVLDPTFGSGGKVSVGISTLAEVGSMVIQSDGKILVAASVELPGSNFFGPTGPLDFLLVRFNSGGVLDTSFGSTGLPNLTGSVHTDLGGDDQAFAVALQDDGKIVVAGCTDVRGVGAFLPSSFAVARYNSNGLLDNTFGSSGRITTNLSPTNHGCLPEELLGSTGNFNGDAALGVAIQADGKIVVVGRTEITNPNCSSCLGIPHIALVRYNPNGTLDTTFGSGGKITSGPGAADAVVIQPDGKIVIAAAGLLTRYTTNGSLDATFGNAGTTASSSRGSFVSLAIQQILLNGRLLAVGDGGSGNCGALCIAVARFNAYTTTLTRVGTFALAPADSVQAVLEPFLYSFTWTVPDPENWRELKTLQLRIRDDRYSIIWVLFDGATDSFSLLNQARRPGPMVEPGSNHALVTPDVILHMTDTNVIAAGPTSATVTLNLLLELKPQTAGRDFLIEVAATDNNGNDTGFVQAGTLSVSPK